jgi:hypothetical protein
LEVFGCYGGAAEVSVLLADDAPALGTFIRCSDVMSKIGKSHYIYQIGTIYELVTHLAKKFPASYGKRKFVATFRNISHSTLSRVFESSTHSSSALFNDAIIGWVDIFSTMLEYNLIIDLWRKDTDRRKPKYSEKPLPVPSSLSQTLYRLAWNPTRAFAM